MRPADYAPIADLLTEEQSVALSRRAEKATPADAWELMRYRPNWWSYYCTHTSGARFNTFTTARQIGKTETLSMEIHDAMTAPPRPDDKKNEWAEDGTLIHREPNYVGVVSFDFEHAEMPVFKYLIRIADAFGEDYYSLNKSKHTITLKSTGAVLKWLSSENPLSGQGHTFTTLFFDESQNVPDEMWQNIRPALDVRNARVFAFGTPDPIPACTWFKGLFLRGEDELAEDYYSFNVPCTHNEWMDLETILDARETLTDSEFRKKYLGQWVDDEGSVFRNIDANFYEGGWTAKYDKEQSYVMGLDLAQAEDYTVAYVVTVGTQEVVAEYRINRLDYVLVEDAIEDLYHKWHCRGIHMDSTGVGAGIEPHLRKRDLVIWPFIFTNKTKEKLVSTLARELEHERVKIPKAAKQLYKELKAFTRTITKAGNVVFSHPVNFNDDTVMALGLALLKTRNGGKVRVSSYIDEIPEGG